MIVEVEDFPWEIELGREALAGLARYGWKHAQVITRSERFYKVLNPAGEIIMAVGVARWSFVRRPELWIMLGKQYTRRLRESLTITREAIAKPLADYGGVLYTEADTRAPHTVRFIEYMGFKRIEGNSLRPDGEHYILYEMRKCQ